MTNEEYLQFRDEMLTRIVRNRMVATGMSPAAQDIANQINKDIYEQTLAIIEKRMYEASEK